MRDNSRIDKWQKFRAACTDVRSARKDMKMRRAKITVSREVLDCDAKRPDACFVQYESVVFPGMPVQNATFMSVCSNMGNMGLCGKCGDCSMKLDNIMYNWALKKLEIEKDARRQCFCEFLGLENKVDDFKKLFLVRKFIQWQEYRRLKQKEIEKAEAVYACYESNERDDFVKLRDEWDKSRSNLNAARKKLFGTNVK